MYSNGYIFRYAAIMVIVAAALLSTAAMLLKPYQERNMAIEKMGGILDSAKIEGCSEQRKLSVSLIKYVAESLVVDKDGNVVESAIPKEVCRKVKLLKLI